MSAFLAIGALALAYTNRGLIREAVTKLARNPGILAPAFGASRQMVLESAASGAKLVIGTYIISSMSKLTHYAPSLQLPGISMGDFSHGDFNFGETNIGDIHLPELDVGKFKEGLVEIGQAIGEAGGMTTAIVGSVFLSLYAAYGIQTVLLEYLKKYVAWIVGQPTLSRKFKFDDLYARMYRVISSPLNLANRVLYGKKVELKKPTPIYDPNLAVQISEIAQSIKSIKKNDGIFTNLILWGPPGTGKTMTAERLAEEAGVNYLEISGGDLAKFIGSTQSPVALLDEVFKRIENSRSPTIIFIDEIDAIGLDRGKLDPARVEILNALLNKIGTPSKQFMVIAATNLPAQLDSALMNRFDDKLYMGPPKAAERREMIKMYIDYFFDQVEDRAIFTPDLIEKMVNDLEGQTGRTIQKIMNKCKIKKTMRPENRLNVSIVTDVLEQFIKGRDLLEEELAKMAISNLASTS